LKSSNGFEAAKADHSVNRSAVITTPGKLRLDRGGQPVPIALIIYGRIVVKGVIIRISVVPGVVIVRVPPIRKPEANEVKTDEETAVIAKELIVKNETMATKVVTRYKLMIKSRSTSCESSHTMTGHCSRRDRQ
jgi:hypothetical protein